MTRWLPIMSCLLGLGACATALSESRSTIVVDGRSYDLITREMEGPNGTFEQSHVIVNNRLYICLPDSPGDCEAAVKTARNDRGGRD